MDLLPPINKRVKDVIELKKKGNVSRFAQEVGLGQQVVNRLFKIDIRTNKYPSVSMNVVRTITDFYPDINQEWLLHGKGDMLKQNLSKESNATEIYNSEEEYEDLTTKSGNKHAIISPGNYRLNVKLVEPRAFAGYLTGYNDTEYIENLPEIEIFVKEVHRGIYRAFRVKGESMEGRTKRAIYDGDVVVGRSLERVLWKSRLHLQERLEWVIVHSGGIVVKHISKHDVDAGIITCVSYNEDKIVYPEFELHLDEVYELYGIVKSINDR